MTNRELTYDEAEAAGFDGTGRDGDPRFPYHVSDILDQSGLPTDLIAKMKSVVSVTSERCYLHPESPTGYVGRGKWCEHRPGHIVK